MCPPFGGIGKGVGRFSDLLPLKADAAVNSLEQFKMHDLSGYRILVVDDEPDTLAYFCTVLEDNGTTVFDATNGDEALQVARREQPDLITLDIAMPGKDGVQVYKEIRVDPMLASIPVCIITGNPELRRVVFQRSVRRPEGYLDKPVDEKRLLRYVRRLAGLSRRNKAAKC